MPPCIHKSAAGPNIPHHSLQKRAYLEGTGPTLNAVGYTQAQNTKGDDVSAFHT